MHRREIAASTLQILDTGRYTTLAGTEVNVGEAIEHAVRDSVLHTAESRPHERALPEPTNAHTTFTVVNQGTLSASRELVASGMNVAALNFASARNPGGGFVNGAEAQEENLARSSALYACETGPTVHAYYSPGASPLYSHAIIYSPSVPVFRDDRTSELLDQPYNVSLITAAAPNAGVARKRGIDEEAILRALAERADRVLSVAARNVHDAVVLGAWGCGVFRNDPQLVAAVFARLLRGKHAGRFRHVTFAVLGPASNRQPFEETFGEAGGAALDTTALEAALAAPTAARAGANADGGARVAASARRARHDGRKGGHRRKLQSAGHDEM